MLFFDIIQKMMNIFYIKKKKKEEARTYVCCCCYWFFSPLNLQLWVAEDFSQFSNLSLESGMVGPYSCSRCTCMGFPLVKGGGPTMRVDCDWGDF